MRRRVVSIIGTAGKDDEALKQARELGRMLIDAGFRIVCGGMTGVMRAACTGARSSKSYREGDCVGIIMTANKDDADPSMDIVIPTGMGLARNAIVVASGDAVVAVGGGAGTLSEIALAWSMEKKIMAIEKSGGWAGKMSGQRLDSRRMDAIVSCKDASQATEAIMEFFNKDSQK